METRKTVSSPSLRKGLAILELLAKSSKGLRLAEIARRLQLPKSSTHSLLLTLERCGYLHRSIGAGRYHFSLKILALGDMALSNLKLRDQAAPFLRELQERTRLTVHMAVLEHEEAVLIERLEPPGFPRIATWIGRRMEMHCTGCGKALLAHFPHDELDRFIREHGLPRHNDNTIASARRIKEELARIRILGYAVDDEEDELGFRCVAAPITERTGEVIAAISVVGTTEQITAENKSSLAVEVKRAAFAISQCIATDVTEEE